MRMNSLQNRSYIKEKDYTKYNYNQAIRKADWMNRLNDNWADWTTERRNKAKQNNFKQSYYQIFLLERNN